MHALCLTECEVGHAAASCPNLRPPSHLSAKRTKTNAEKIGSKRPTTSTGSCAVSGIKFDRRVGKRSPWMPSIERIDCLDGYVVGNVRWVSLAANIALNDFGFDVLIRLANGVALKASGGLAPDIALQVDALKGACQRKAGFTQEQVAVSPVGVARATNQISRAVR